MFLQYLIKIFRKLAGTFLTMFLILFFPHVVNAVSCQPAPGDATHSITTDCSFTYSVDGLDFGTGSTNNSVLSVDSGVLTVLGTQDIAVGSINVNSGSIAIIDGGSMHIGSPIYALDADSDGVLGSFTFSLTNIANTVRRNILSSYSLDCNDSDISAWTTVNGYLDSDGDGYGSTTSGSACTDGSLPANLVTNSNDCYDGNVNAKPGSTYCSGVDRGDGSFDYNCSGGNSTCGTTFYPTSVITDIHYSNYLGRCNNYGSKTVILTSTGGGTCGVSGYTRSTYRSAACGTSAYYLLGTAGQQACQ